MVAATQELFWKKNPQSISQSRSFLSQVAGYKSAT